VAGTAKTSAGAARAAQSDPDQKKSAQSDPDQKKKATVKPSTKKSTSGAAKTTSTTGSKSPHTAAKSTKKSTTAPASDPDQKKQTIQGLRLSPRGTRALLEDVSQMAHRAVQAIPQSGAESHKRVAASLSAPDASLEWLIHPISKETFFSEYWEKKPLLLKRKQPHHFDSLLSLDEVDRVLTTLDLRHPNVTLKNAEKTVTTDDYTLDGEVLDVAKLYQLFREGSTISLPISTT
jgi:hypothetical protein